MKITNIENLYLKKHNDDNRKLDFNGRIEKAKSKIEELRNIPSYNRVDVHETARELFLLAYGLGLQEKLLADEGDYSELAVVIASKEEIETNRRTPIAVNIVRGLQSDGVAVIKAVNCDLDRLEDMNTYVLFADVQIGSDIFKKLQASAERYNLDIRVTSRAFFK